MDKQNVHLTFNAENVAVPDVLVEVENEAADCTDTVSAAERDEKCEHTKAHIVTHIRYDDLAVPEVEIEETLE